jgi:putative FmdB family regulatory protein
LFSEVQLLPLYEYQCPACGRFEVIRKFSDAPLKACPTCGKRIQKLASAPAIQFKGAGWYVNDYAKKSGPGSSKGDGAAASTSGSEASKAESSKSEPSKVESSSKSESSKPDAAPKASTPKDGSAPGSGPSK